MALVTSDRFVITNPGHADVVQGGVVSTGCGAARQSEMAVRMARGAGYDGVLYRGPFTDLPGIPL